MMDRLPAAATLLIGVNLGLVIAEYGYGASGLFLPEAVAFFGFVITSGLHLWLKAKGNSGAKS